MSPEEARYIEHRDAAKASIKARVKQALDNDLHERDVVVWVHEAIYEHYNPEEV